MRSRPPLTFIAREEGEPLAMHLHRNAEAIGADREQRARLKRAAAWSLSDDRDLRISAITVAGQVQDELNANLLAAIYTAQARGERIAPFNDDGAMRIKSRDGLWSMRDSGSLSPAQVEAGLSLRALYEAAGPTALGSQLGNAGEVASRPASTDRMVRVGLDRAYAGVRVTDAISAVLRSDPSGLGVRAVIGVACEGHTVGALAKSGHARAKMVAALRSGLDIVRARLTESGGLRITGS